ncbi:MAG: Npt1/Npt2 family nucleotide transporter [Pseudomonadota bacterium]
MKLISIKKEEILPLCVACLHFFLVLCTYYIIRPIRAEMAVANGIDNIQWLFLFAMLVLIAIAPIFGWITSRYRTRQFLSIITGFFALNLFIFYFLFNVEERSVWVTRSFYVWVNAFSMFIVSLFWSFMNDIFESEQARRLFAFIAAGGTVGAISGPIITTNLVEQLGLAPLLIVSGCVLTSSIFTIKWLVRWRQRRVAAAMQLDEPQLKSKGYGQALKGDAFSGLKLIIKSPYLLAICLFITLYAVSITFVVIQQAEMIEKTYSDPAARTKLFAQIDLIVNVVTLLVQIFVTSKLLEWIGFRNTLLIIPLGISVGFGLIALFPILPVIIAVEVFRRSGDYAIMKPAREMLFSVVSREEKYKSKNFIDTAILRTGDTISGWLYAGLKALGGAGGFIPAISMAMGAAWCVVAFWLGSEYRRKVQTPHVEKDNEAANGASL